MDRRTAASKAMIEKQRAAQEDGHEAVARSETKPSISTPASDSRQAARTYGDEGAYPDDVPRLTSLVPIDADRRVAHVDVGPFSIGSLWLIGCASGAPRVSWPCTSRGYPIIEVADPLRSEIEALVLAGEKGEDPPQPRRRRPARRQKAKPKRSRPVVDPELDDPLDDLLGGPTT